MAEGRYPLWELSLQLSFVHNNTKKKEAAHKNKAWSDQLYIWNEFRKRVRFLKLCTFSAI